MAVDVLIVGLGSTAGLRVAEEQLAGSLQRAGVEVALVRARRPREVRTFMLTDLAWARAARAAAVEGVRTHEPRAVVYAATTSALLWPRPGAIRYDALSADNRPGRHGLWQRPLERRRLRQATVLVPWAPPAPRNGVVVPIAVTASGPTDGPRDIAAVTYGANAPKKGLDHVLAAWADVRADGEELIVAGARDLPPAPGVRDVGMLAPEEYRALLRRARVYVTAPRREDHGIAQLEALADGAQLVTTPAPGPYAALPVARALDPRLVPDGPDGLGAALRAALDAPLPGYAAAALQALEPFTPAAVDRVVAEELLPRLLA